MPEAEIVCKGVYNLVMANHVIHVSEVEAASDLGKLLERVRAGAEVVIESGKLPVAVMHAPCRCAGPSPNASRCCPKNRMP